jgi:hypothetical protein
LEQKEKNHESRIVSLESKLAALESSLTGQTTGGTNNADLDVKQIMMRINMINVEVTKNS